MHLNNPHSTHVTTRKGRAILPINSSLMEALIEARRVAMSDYVIEWHGQPAKRIDSGIKAVADKAGIKDITPHVFRHTAAVWMAEAGISMHVIAQYPEHSSTFTTEGSMPRYSPDYLRGAAKALEIKL